ncbi:MAG: transglutaminase domain-containing protein [Armatimonadota bacterium]
MSNRTWGVIAFSICLAALHLPALSAVCDESRFAQIDQYVAQTPDYAEASVNSLADYLVKSAPKELSNAGRKTHAGNQNSFSIEASGQPPLGAQNDTEKARAIYSWIIHNVDFDPVIYASGKYGDQKPEAVLKSRKTVCGGFAGLFEALAKRAGLQVAVIPGFSRGKGYYPGVKSDRRDHAWNAVMLDGKWHLLDTIWGAGYVDANNLFVRKPCEHYFLTPPERFISDHFPEDPNWQLLDKPVSKDDYDRTVYIRPAFFRNNLKLVSHTEGVVNSDCHLAVQLDSPEEVLVKAEVNRGDVKAEDASVFIQREHSRVTVNTLFPRSGDYILRIYAKPRSAQGMYDWVADYSVRVSSTPNEPADFPMAFETFHERNAYLYAPMTGHLKSGSTETFKISAPEAITIAVIVDGKWLILQKNGDVFEGQALVKGAAVQVAARFAGSQKYLVLLQYTVS